MNKLGRRKESYALFLQFSSDFLQNDLIEIQTRLPNAHCSCPSCAPVCKYHVWQGEIGMVGTYGGAFPNLDRCDFVGNYTESGM